MGGISEEIIRLRAGGAGEIMSVDTRRLLPAACHFNPSLVWVDGSLWMVYRRVTPEPDLDVLLWPRLLGLCRLGADLQPDPASNIDLSARIVDPPGARHWHADARFFTRRDGPWLHYHDNHDLFVTPLRPQSVPELLRPVPLVLLDRPRRERERNWGCFDDGQFKAVYTIDPHVIVSLSETAARIEARPKYETRTRIPWDCARWGEPHGGTTPIRVGDCWYAFFQSSALATARSSQKIYVVGFYGFDAQPPHRIRYMSKRPIIDGGRLGGPLSFWNDYVVAYPSGAVFAAGSWLLSLGIHDRRIGFIALAHNDLLDGCAVL